MKTKVLNIIIICFLIASLLGAVVWTCVRYCYYSRYTLCKENYDVSKKADSNEITVMSFNIRCFTFDDLFKKSFFYRSPLIIKEMQENEPDIISFQEVQIIGYEFLKQHLQGYTFIDGFREGSENEGAIIAIRSDRFTIVDSGRFWLSETPDVQSYGWDAACIRVATYAYVTDTVTNKKYTIVDTHLDHVGEEARIKGIGVILDRLGDKIAQGSFMLMGDMNDFVGSDTYEYALSQGLNDAQLVAGETYLGPGATYHSYGKILNNARIDFFFISNDITVNSYKVVDKTYGGVYSSDHFPILMKIAQ
ncbi:MAG: endonuclease/exonuclease/phosphatase family protein [Clostridia bacterium]|nr:endonuclease/exonuclease/phosphatase family protein [Clostridia bacterium]